MSGRHEFPDDTPVEVPLNFRRPLTLQEEIQRLIRNQMSQNAAAQGFESFEEANDFDVDDDADPFTQYEVAEMQEEPNLPKESENGKVEPGGAAMREGVPKAGGENISAQSSAGGRPESAGSAAEGRGAGAAVSK